MSSSASRIAISELSGVPLEQMCGFIVLIVSHPEQRPGAHQLNIIPAAENWSWAQSWLETAARDLKESKP
jgi:hypothetical protein